MMSGEQPGYLKHPGERSPLTGSYRRKSQAKRAWHPDRPKVAKNAIPNAASIAGVMLTTEALVSEIQEKEKAPAGMPGGGGMGGMY